MDQWIGSDMNTWKVNVVILAISICSSHALAELPHPPPPVFLDSVTVGKYDIDFHIPDNFHQVSQDVTSHGQIIGFIPKDQKQDNWKQHIALSITYHADKTANQRLQEIQKYYTDTYQNVDIDNGRFSRYQKKSASYNKADCTIYYEEGKRQFVTHVTYFSDQETLIGSQITSSVDSSISKSKRYTASLSKQIISLKE